MIQFIRKLFMNEKPKAAVSGATMHTTILNNPDTEQRVGVKVAANVPNLYQDVIDFHKKFGIQYDGPPRQLPEQLDTFRRMRFHEEVKEIRDAQDANQLAELLDGYVDLIYIVLGTCHLHGWDFNEAWRRVHAANMKKELTSPTNPGKYGSKTDIVKPADWVAPTMQDLVTTPKS